MKKVIALFLISILSLSFITGCRDRHEMMMKKPVIYLYPTTKTDISVKLDLENDFSYTYPEYSNGWNVTAYPDGRIINNADGKEYSYLFWEANSSTKFDYSKGFVVKAEDTETFLSEKLSYMGLTPKEYNEFIVFWAPQLKRNPYNLITFQGDTYTNSAKLNISPEPDSILRIFMAAKPLSKPINITPQELSSFKRTGFSVIEWGGIIE